MAIHMTNGQRSDYRRLLDVRDMELQDRINAARANCPKDELGYFDSEDPAWMALGRALRDWQVVRQAIALEDGELVEFPTMWEFEGAYKLFEQEISKHR